MRNAIVAEVVEKLTRLPENLQRKVLHYVDTLAAARPRGVPGKDLLRFAGVISKEDAEEMRSAIEAGCEQVDLNEW
jgi:hypothetical protein